MKINERIIKMLNKIANIVENIEIKFKSFKIRILKYDKSIQGSEFLGFDKLKAEYL